MPDATDPIAIPPSRYRRFTQEEHEHLPIEPDSAQNPAVDDPASIRRISTTTLASAAQCPLRAHYRVLGLPGMAPSPFTQSSMADGKAFENALCGKPSSRETWILSLNRTVGLDLPPDLPLIEVPSIRIGTDESPEAFCARNRLHLSAILQTHVQPGIPIAFHSVPLSHTTAGTLLSGTCDLLVWTGTHMILGDIKCSEEARTSHGLQVSHYQESWHHSIGAPDTGTPYPLHPDAFIVHCATGYRFTVRAPVAKREECLSFTQVTAVKTEALRPHFEAHLEQLLKTTPEALSTYEDQANFIAACTECEFRYRCYPRFLNQQPISMLPLMRAEIASLRALGIHTLDALAHILEQGTTHPDYASVFDLREQSPIQMHLLADSVAKARAHNGSCTFRIPPECAANPLFFTRCGEHSTFHSSQPQQAPTCLVVYTEAERASAWAQLLHPSDRSSPLPNETFVLSEEIRSHAHFLLPSLTLKPLAAWCAGFQSQSTDDSTTRLQADTRWEELEADDQCQERMEALIAVWNFLTAQAYEPAPLTSRA